MMFFILHMNLFDFRMAQSESVQYFQFDQEGNMFVYPPGGGLSGIPKLVKPGDEMIFSSVETESIPTN